MKKTKSSKKIVLKITMSMTRTRNPLRRIQLTRSVKGRVALTGINSMCICFLDECEEKMKDKEWE